MGKPLLIFANKQDQTGALTEDEVRARLELDSLLGEHRQNARVVSIHVHVHVIIIEESCLTKYSQYANACRGESECIC